MFIANVQLVKAAVLRILFRMVFGYPRGVM